ncbi:MAG: RidA family protein [Rhodospirillaceae bacterium]
MPQISSLTTTLAAVAVTCMAYAASAADTTSTNIVRNPTGGYTQRSVEIPSGSRILFISGQTATDAEGFTPPDAETQADIVYAKVEQTLKDAGMDWSDVVKTNLYMINPADIGAIVKAGQKYNPGGTQAGTLVYVKALALPEVLIELEAVAAKKE